MSVCNERSILEAENQHKLNKQKQNLSPSRQRRATTCRDLETWNKHFLYPQCEQQKTFPCDAATGIRISSAAPSACRQLTWLTVWQLLAGLLAAPCAAHNSGSVQHSLSGDLHFITSWSSFPPHFSVHFIRRTASPPTSLSPALHRDSLIIMSKSHCECFKGNN